MVPTPHCSGRKASEPSPDSLGTRQGPYLWTPKPGFAVASAKLASWFAAMAACHRAMQGISPEKCCLSWASDDVGTQLDIRSQIINNNSNNNIWFLNIFDDCNNNNPTNPFEYVPSRPDAQNVCIFFIKICIFRGLLQAAAPHASKSARWSQSLSVTVVLHT